MTSQTPDGRIETGIPSLDRLLGGGLPRGSVTIVSGPPGSGKTILAQQLCFHNATPETRVLYFTTLSEPAAKQLRYLGAFSFFDAQKFEASMTYVDLGDVLLSQGSAAAGQVIADHVKRIRPTIVVIDGFKVFDDLASSQLELRKFSYALAVTMMAWETTTILIGEYDAGELQTSPLFSIIDGKVLMSQRDVYGEQLRFCRVAKMRGTNHDREEHQFVIGPDGIALFAPRRTIQREDRGTTPARIKTGISHLDELLGAGIPAGSSLLVAGVAGTGKTALLLDFIYRGALTGEKGILFSFEETEERLVAAATGFGMDLEAQIARGMIEVIFVPQPDIMVEAGIEMMQQRIQALGAQRVAIDSLSVFLHKIRDPQIAREKVFQLASIVQNAQAVGFLATDIAYGTALISRFGVEETVVDGVILLTSTEEGLERQRYLEVYKLRNTAHLKGRHSMVINGKGIGLYPRFTAETVPAQPPPAMGEARLSTGVADLDALLDGGLRERSVTLVAGSAGVGKTILGLHFLAAGLAAGEPGIYVTLEEGPEQVLQSARAMGHPWDAAIAANQAKVVYLSPDNIRSSQVRAILTEKILAQGTRRLVIDGVAHLAGGLMPRDELREVLLVLTTQFKLLGVTTLLTLETTSLNADDVLTERNFSAVSDNFIALRFAMATGELKPYMTIVKTRGSAHDRGTYSFSIDAAGLHLGPRLEVAPPDMDRVRWPRTT